MPDSVTPPSAVQPVDADVDLHVPAQRRELTGAMLGMLSVISVGACWARWLVAGWAWPSRMVRRVFRGRRSR
jgi:hypothetical protein